MTSRSLGCGWLRGRRREETNPSVLRGICVALVTLGVFFLLVAVASMSGCSPGPASGIKGTVTIGPVSPVVTSAAVGSKPYATTLVITPQGGLHLKRPVRVESGADGSFTAALEPGSYLIEAQNAQTPPTLAPLPVTVDSGRYTEVQVRFDSGIR